MHVFVAGESTLARHPFWARQAEQQAAASAAGTVARILVVLRAVSANVSQPLPSEAGADKVQTADPTPLSGKFGLDPTTAWSLSVGVPQADGARRKKASNSA
jgi:hypothetical protein